MTSPLSFRGLRNALLLTLVVAMGGIVWGGGGVTGTGRFSSGMITDFASVIVNGIEYFTTNANISINGNEHRLESELRIGMVTRVVGTLNSDRISGQASKIAYDADLIGTVDAAPTGGSGAYVFSVYGLDVATGTDTVFDGVLAASGLNAGDTVEVSGLLDASTGSIQAKRVERKVAPAPLQLTGPIGNLTASTFALGDLTVDYSNAMVTGLPAGGLVSGARVRVKAPAQTSTGLVTATAVQGSRGDVAEGEGLEADLEGIVANLSGTSFSLGNVTVATNAATLYVNGAAANLANGAEIQADGHILNGVMTADKVSFPKPDPVTFTGQVVSRSGDTLTVFSSNGVKVRANADTRINDNTGVVKSRFSISDIRAGDRITVKGNPDDDQVVMAFSLVRTKADPAVDLTGRVGTAAALNLTVLNQMVHTPSNTKFSDAKGRTLTADAFYAQVAGHTLQVKGTAVNGVIEATRADIQP